MRSCVITGCDQPSYFKVVGEPVCWEHAAQEMDRHLGPTEDGRPGSVMVPVGLERES